MHFPLLGLCMGNLQKKRQGMANKVKSITDYNLNKQNGGEKYNSNRRWKILKHVHVF